MSFFTELKRRNVFRVGIAYLIGSWLLAQIAELLLDTFKAPDWTMQFIVVLLLIGFPIAMFFAWAFEMTPEGIKRESEVDRSQSIRRETGQKLNRGIIAILVIALAYFVWESRFADKAQPGSDHYSQNSPDHSQPGSEHYSQRPFNQTNDGNENSALTPVEATPTSTEATKPTQKSVAVLPFVNMSSDPEQEYFSDGITEEIINALVKIPGLSVPARTSVFGFKGHQGDVRNIGGQLGVAHVLEGSIRSQGSQVRITAQLIKVDDGFHLWSETFDRKLDNIFVVQEEIASAIATVLTGELGLGIITVPNKTQNMQAYDSYLKGRALLHKRGTDNLDQAIEYFNRTTELDPEFAPAWAAMALTYSVMELDNEVVTKALISAKHALSLDTENVDALDALASVLRESWQWAEAESYFDQAMIIDPQSSELLEDYAEFLGGVGRLDEYLAVAEKGYTIDPLLGPLADSYTWALMAQGQFGKAIAVIEQWNRSMNPDDILTFWHEPYWKMIPLMASGDNAGTIEMVSRLGSEYMASPTRDAIIDLLKRPKNLQARESLRTIINTDKMSGYDTDVYMATFVLLHAGDVDFVIDRVIAHAQAYKAGNLEPLWSPSYASFRQHPRFEEYLELLNLPGYWDQTGWPEMCRRKDNGRIECQ